MCDSTKLNKVGGGSRNGCGCQKKDAFKQTGGDGFFYNVEADRIGGLSEVGGYTSHPEFLKGKLVQQTTPDGRLMGKGDLCGGGGKNNVRAKRKSNNNNNVRVNNVRVNNVRVNNNKKSSKKRSWKKRSGKKKKNKNKNKNKSSWFKKMSKNRRRNKSKNKNRRRRSRKNRQVGGSEYKILGDGHTSVYHDNMADRKFDCQQPNWDPKCT